LDLTLGIPGGTAEADVKMVVVPPPGAEFVQPWRTGGLPTQHLLDRRIDKNALHSFELCRDPQQLRMLW
jgi:hypothetical protein